MQRPEDQPGRYRFLYKMAKVSAKEKKLAQQETKKIMEQQTRLQAAGIDLADDDDDDLATLIMKRCMVGEQLFRQLRLCLKFSQLCVAAAA